MRPELLAPAGSPEALRAAVQNGADAVYLGWGAFNARRGAKNFSDEEFAAALAYCHERGVRVFLTLNTLVTDRELPQALETAVQAGRLGVDAVLVQDWGLFGLLRRTLQAWFRHNVQPLATSKALFIHRNTLEYRLNRISELTGLDLGSFDDRLLLYVALQLDEQR